MLLHSFIPHMSLGCHGKVCTENYTAKLMAQSIYESLFKKTKKHDDDCAVIVYLKLK